MTAGIGDFVERCSLAGHLCALVSVERPRSLSLDFTVKAITDEGRRALIDKYDSSNTLTCELLAEDGELLVFDGYVAQVATNVPAVDVRNHSDPRPFVPLPVSVHFSVRSTGAVVIWSPGTHKSPLLLESGV